MSISREQFGQLSVSRCSVKGYGFRTVNCEFSAIGYTIPIFRCMNGVVRNPFTSFYRQVLSSYWEAYRMWDVGFR
jgi:hypothetical protein